VFCAEILQNEAYLPGTSSVNKLPAIPTFPLIPRPVGCIADLHITCGGTVEAGRILFQMWLILVLVPKE